MKSQSYHILRVGMAITFLWIGILIFQNPELWAAYVQEWFLKITPTSLTKMMYITALFNITTGFFLLIDFGSWIVSMLMVGHLAIVLVVSGITAITVRDIAIIAGAAALAIHTWPPDLSVREIRRFLKNSKLF